MNGIAAVVADLVGLNGATVCLHEAAAVATIAEGFNPIRSDADVVALDAVIAALVHANAVVLVAANDVSLGRGGAAESAATSSGTRARAERSSGEANRFTMSSELVGLPQGLCGQAG